MFGNILHIILSKTNHNVYFKWLMANDTTIIGHAYFSAVAKRQIWASHLLAGYKQFMNKVCSLGYKK